MTIQQLINHTSRSITSAAVVLGGASLLSRLLGLIRDRLLTHQFGAGAVLDTYTVAFPLPAAELAALAEQDNGPLAKQQLLPLRT